MMPVNLCSAPPNLTFGYAPRSNRVIRPELVSECPHSHLPITVLPRGGLIDLERSRAAQPPLRGFTLDRSKSIRRSASKTLWSGLRGALSSPACGGGEPRSGGGGARSACRHLAPILTPLGPLRPRLRQGYGVATSPASGGRKSLTPPHTPSP